MKGVNDQGDALSPDYEEFNVSDLPYGNARIAIQTWNEAESGRYENIVVKIHVIIPNSKRLV